MIYNNTTPYFINTKMGFMKINFEGDNRIRLSGFTPNLRNATPVYTSIGIVCEIAKKLLREARTAGDYFVIIEPTLIGFNKEKDNNHESN